MSLIALEIDDTAITLADASGVIRRSPGYALFTGSGPHFGQEAVRQALLYPTQTNSRFWELLSAKPLSQPADSGYSHLDLVYWHLESLWKEVGAGVQALILALPGDYTRAQLSGLLGVVRALDMPVRAMVDSALVAAEPADAELWHLDLQLHRTLITRVVPRQGWARAGVEVVHTVGLESLYRLCAQAIATSFLRQCRFDPLHAAVSEQALHDRLPTLFRELQGTESVSLTLDLAGQRFSARVARAELAEALARPVHQIVAAIPVPAGTGAPVPVQVASQLALLPGFLEQLAGAGNVRPLVSSDGAAALGALRRAAELLHGDDPVRFSARLTASAETAAGA